MPDVTLGDIGGAVLDGRLTFGDIGKSVLGGLVDEPRPGFVASQRASSEGATSSRRRNEYGGALSERITRSTIAQTFGFQGAGLEEKPRPTREMQRRARLKTRLSTVAQVFDQTAEKNCSDALERPYCLRTCIDSPDCEVLCNPANHATRDRRQKLANGLDNAKGADGGTAGRKFGLPDFVNAGFALVPLEEAVFEDLNVPFKLFLQFAIHRKTSVERLCLLIPKIDLPKETGPEQIKLLARNLLKCDHVNILQCMDACEDPENLYFLYENFPSVTLPSVLEQQSWTQDQVVNTAREVCAATAFASSMGLCHLGLTLYHVLMPPKCLTGDIIGAKLFGYGLMGVLFTDSVDRQCWSPEMVEKFKQCGPRQNFIQRVEASNRAACDSWGLGIIIFTMIARHTPWSSVTQTLEQMILSRKWGFTSSFDEYDREAKGLIEGLLNSDPNKRLPAAHGLKHEWIRSRWRPLAGCEQTFRKLEAFCNNPRAKRLFGRFLVRFLTPEHIRIIVHSFYTLDARGDGVLDVNDLIWAAESADEENPKKTAGNAVTILGQGFPVVSISRFAESMAEDVIDGKALRHAFESLDDDGSEQISAPELFEALSKLDVDLTMDEVVAHIESAELGIADDCGTQDHQLDFDEFIHLFPERMKKLHALDDRAKSTRDHSDGLGDQFSLVRNDAHDWVKALDREIDNIRDLSARTVDRRQNSTQCVHDLKKHFGRVKDYLRKVPGPSGFHEIEANCKEKQKKQVTDELKAAKGKKAKKDKTANQQSDTYGFASFLQDQALLELWPVIILNEVKLLNAAMSIGKKASDGVPVAAAEGGVDQYKAHDAAESVVKKVQDVLTWAAAQLEEYESFVEVLTSPETPMNTLSYSGRGLQNVDDDDLEPGQDADLDVGAGHGTSGESPQKGGAGSIIGKFFQFVT